MVGRPPLYDDPEKLQEKIDEYFISIEGDDHPTITGLVLHCGFTDRHSFYDYEKKAKFTHTIKKARTRIEQIYEKALFKSGITSGAIFGLKNFGWTDKTEHEITGKGGGALSVALTGMIDEYRSGRNPEGDN